ncbi:MAG: putative lipid II flippase FtsW [Candidatus Pacebacteria bacterium]|nr:putative lipid II flippase FtsW [Candidatus Paceibacterota bacterium]
MKRGRKKTRKYNLKPACHAPDWWLVGLVLLLSVFGLIIVANASAVAAFRDFGNKLHYFRLQFQWLILGLTAFAAACFFPYQKWRKLVPLLLFLTFLSLVLVVLPKFGFRRFGARRWLNLGGFSFQPAELTKLSFITYLAAYLTKKEQVWPLLLVSGLILFLVMLQPDLGTTLIILAIGFVVYFVGGMPWWQMLVLGLGASLGSFLLIVFSPYRRERWLTFLDPQRDPLGASYHIRQVLIALGSGGLFGVGLGQSRQKYEYLPAVSTDSIFAVVAEELGFAGAAALVLVFAFLIWRGIRVAQLAPDHFAQLLAVGVTAWVALQTFINLAAMVALAPLTGTPLPFISYGGSSLLLILLGMGILVNISRQTLS